MGYNRPINSYYEIGVILGECDAEQGFRTLEYWAKERERNPRSNHFAVLVAENLQGKHRRVIEILSQFVPFIGIELHNYQLALRNGEKTILCKSEIIMQPESLVQIGGIDTFTEGKSIYSCDEEWWRLTKGDKFVDTVKEMYEDCEKSK